jgi:arabinogalactan oligomer/maltooligosaccharide transport system permease protein
MTGTIHAVPQGRGGLPPRPSTFGRYGASSALIVKYLLLAALNALVLAGLPTMLDKPDYPMAIGSVVALLAIDVVYLTKRLVPHKYLLPGTLFLLVFALYPVIYTIYNSTTNYGTGNNLSKGQAIDQIEEQSISSTEGATRYDLQIIAESSPTGRLAFLLTDPDGNRFLGTADGLTPLEESQIIADGRRETIEGYVALNAGESQDRILDVNALVVPGPDGDIVNDGFGNAFSKVQRLRYDESSNTMVDTVDGTVFRDVGGSFRSESGQTLLPGWRSNIGIDNYDRLFTDPDVRNPFVRVFVWTVVFALFSVLLSFALGLLLAIVFNEQRMRGRRIYRSMIIIPYALPSFMTALVWKGMLNQQFGVVNRWLGTSLPWLDGDWLPYASILLVNTWLGYPYMFLVCTGALQSIPSDLTEAAAVDGATGLAAFRRITFPLLLVAVAPLLIASFAFNFNNFNIIYLLTEGRPPIPGSDAGRTDILISYTYKLAFAGGRGADYGFASAVSFIIFLLVAGISAYSFRFTKAFEGIR